MADLVAIDLPGGPAFVDALRRIWDAGDAALPLDQRIPAAARLQVLELMGAGAVVGPDGRSARAGGRPVEPGDALVVTTSGTGGRPKGVVLTAAAVAASARATSARLDVLPDRHRWVACLPLNHVGGLSVVTRSLLTGTPVTVLPGFAARAVADLSGPDALVSLVPAVLPRVDPSAWRTIVLGGSAPPDDRPANAVVTYGMTETGSGVVYDGRPLDGVEVGLDGRGAIRLRGPMLLRCYRDGHVPLDAGGWLQTGDAGVLDAEGRLSVTGRLSDLIITGGENVWPDAVEAVLSADPGVAEVAVAGRPDPEWGQRVVAWIVPTGGPPPLDRLRAAVAERIGPWAAPRELVMVDHLPRTPLGKVRRAALPGAGREDELRPG